MPLTPYNFTEREFEIIKHLAQGLTGPDIAKELKITLNTVHSHKSSIYRKLKSKKIYNVQQLIEFAVKEGMLSSVS